ncbi:MAG: hypothetical protein WD883_01425 [Candidatus Colwellbacteria bacterium]
MKRFTLTITIGLILLISPATFAQTVDFNQLAITDDATPEMRFSKKVELTADALKKANERVVEMRDKLEEISLEEETLEGQLRDELVIRTQEYSQFYDEQIKALKEAKAIEEVDTLIDTIISYREVVYSPGAREILEFILVYSYTPSVLDVANQRLENIKRDVSKLERLKLVEPNSFTPSLADAETVFQEAKDLHLQAAALLIDNYSQSLLIEPTATSTDEVVTDTTPVEQDTQLLITPKGLAEQSLTKIKTLYQLFMETGDRVTQSLGIGS